MPYGIDENEIFEKIDFWTKRRKYVLTKPEADMMQKSLRMGMAAEIGGAVVGGGIALLIIRKFVNPYHLSSLAKFMATGSVVLAASVLTAEGMKCANKVRTVRNILDLDNSVIAATTKEIMRSSENRDVFRDRYPKFKEYLESRSWERAQPDPELAAALAAANERRAQLLSEQQRKPIAQVGDNRSTSATSSSAPDSANKQQ